MKLEETSKRIAKEDASYEREGTLRGMGIFNQTAETLADITEKPIQSKKRPEEAMDNFLDNEVHPKQKLSS